MTEERDSERDAIIKYLEEEASDAMAYHQCFGVSDLSQMAVIRAGFYRQAAAFIGRNEHRRADRPRPTWAKPEALATPPSPSPDMDKDMIDG